MQYLAIEFILCWVCYSKHPVGRIAFDECLVKPWCGIEDSTQVPVVQGCSEFSGYPVRVEFILSIAGRVSEGCVSCCRVCVQFYLLDFLFAKVSE